MTYKLSGSDRRPIDVAIIGAGPYGLSIAAHLRARNTPFRIFGMPMHSWQHRMPAGMSLKSDGFASDLYDPAGTFTLAAYCRQQHLPYAEVGHPVPLETFVAYGLEFQRRLVPDVEQTEIISVRKVPGGFTLTTRDGDSIAARKVVVAVGISHFGHVPEWLSHLPGELATHSSQYGDFDRLRGLRVAVIGGGSSAVDLAVLLHEAGIDVQLAARRRAIDFHPPPQEPRPFLEQMLKPRSGLGLGWRSRLCTDAPLLFHAMPRDLRLRVVRSHLGPSPGWFMKERFAGRVPAQLGVQFRGAAVRGNGVELTLTRPAGGTATLSVDHVIAATGYRVSLRRLTFLDEALRNRIRSIEDTPVLDRRFGSSVDGLFMVGVASANSFGPLTRFAYGAGFTARRILPALTGTGR